MPAVRSQRERSPPTAGGVESFRVRSEQLDRYMDEALVSKTDHDTSLTCHSRVNRVTREQIAQQSSSEFAGRLRI